MEIVIPYNPHSKQTEIHESGARFKIVAAGRRSGKTTLAINELIKQAVSHPGERSWFVCETYKQAEMVGWRTALRYIPRELIKKIHTFKLNIELTNNHLIEFKGCDQANRLRGVALRYVVLDEYGLMSPDVWTEVIRPMLIDNGGEALFIGTPGPDGSPHFHELFNRGQKKRDPAYKSWLFHTTDNPAIPKSEIIEAKRDLPPDIFRREFEADFDCTAGLIYDNFSHPIHVIPHYEPDSLDFVVGSIDPGLVNPTAALLCAWDRHGVGRIFKEYYVKDLLAGENALQIKAMARPYKVGYWVIDRASNKREMSTGFTVYNKYGEYLKPLLAAANDPGSVWAGLDEVKKLFQTKRLFITAQCHWLLWEIGRYIRYKHKWRVERNEEEKPRKLNDHLCDAMRNMIYSKPWIRPSIHIYQPARTGYT